MAIRLESEMDEHYGWFWRVKGAGLKILIEHPGPPEYTYPNDRSEDYAHSLRAAEAIRAFVEEHHGEWREGPAAADAGGDAEEIDVELPGVCDYPAFIRAFATRCHDRLRDCREARFVADVNLYPVLAGIRDSNNKGIYETYVDGTGHRHEWLMGVPIEFAPGSATKGRLVLRVR